MANKLVNVELFKAGVEEKLGMNRKLYSLVESESVSNVQVGTINLVTNEYVGDAVVVAKGKEIPVSDLVQTTTPVKFEKIAKGVEIADEEANSGFGDVVGNAQNQTVMAIDGAMEAQVAKLLESATVVAEKTKVDTAGVLQAISTFGDHYDTAPAYLIVNPADYAALQGEVAVNNELVPTIFGAEIIMSNRIDAGAAYLVQQGAIKEFIQKDTQVEDERDASRKTTGIFTDKIYGAYVADASKLVKIGGAVTGS